MLVRHLLDLEPLWLILLLGTAKDDHMLRVSGAHLGLGVRVLVLDVRAVGHLLPMLLLHHVVLLVELVMHILLVHILELLF